LELQKKIENLIKRISKINSKASIIKSKKGLLPIKEFYGLNDYQPNTESWDVRQWLSDEKNKVMHSHDHKHHHDINRHDDDIKSFSLVTNKPVSMTSLNFFLELLSNQMGEKMLRIKGIINVEGEDRPAIIHGVQHIFHPLEWLDKWPDNDVSTRLVFITNKIEKSIVEQFFKIIE
jgi:G3E family GTPase